MSLRPKNPWLLFFAAIAWLFGPMVVRVNAQLNYLQVLGNTDPGARVPVENGYVDAATGNLHLEVPLGSFPQRGLPTLTAKLIYDSRIWQSVYGVWQATNVANSQGGWRFIMTGGPGSVSYSTYPWNDGQGHYGTTYAYFTWTAPDSTIHPFPFKTWTATVGTPSPSADGVSTDASGYHMWVTNWTSAVVYAPDGRQVYPSEKDSNGNYFGVDAQGNLTDTVDRTPVKVRSCGNSGNSTCYDVQNSETTGTVSTYTVTTATIHVKTNFGQGTDCTTSCPTITVIQSIQLPDSSKYSFQYDCDKAADSVNCSSAGSLTAYYGLLTSMTLPTGGTISYTHANFSDAYGNVQQWISKRTTPDSSTGWVYAPQVNTTCPTGGVNCNQQLTVTAPNDPNGNNTVYYFNLNGGAHASEIDSYTGLVSGSNLLSKVTPTWDYTHTCPQFALCVGPGAAYVTETGSTTALTMPGGTTVNKTTQYTWDTTFFSGAVLQISEWNFYTGSLPAAADRTTFIGYLNGTSYVNANIVNRQSSVTVVDKNGNTVAGTLLCYDYASGCGSYPLNLSFGSATLKANHDDTNFGTTNSVRGDLTQVLRLVSSSTSLTKSMRYDMTGQLIQETDWSNLSANSTSYSYADTFFTDSGDQQNPATKTVSPSTNAYLTMVTYPTVGSLALTQTLGYYWGMGQLALSMDANLNKTYFHFFNSLNLPTSTAFPDGGWTYNIYDVSTGSNPIETGIDSYTGINPSTTLTTTCLPLTTSTCRHDQLGFDLPGLGRAAKQILVSDPDGQSEVDTAYDPNGRVLTVSNPYRTISDPTYGLETPSYDGLNRTTGVKHYDKNSMQISYGANVGGTGGSTFQYCSSSTYGFGYPIVTEDESAHYRQTWTDGFSRVIETDEADANNQLTAHTCYTYDLNNNLTGVTSLAVTPNQTRSYSYDMLSRITSKRYPESGTTCFYYTTSGGTCGVSGSGTLCSGDPMAVCRKTDARGITTTYAYDAMNRLTGKNYTDNTKPRYYYYSETGRINGKGRLTSAQTYDPTAGASVTDSWFDYDSVGRITHVQEYVASGTGVYQQIYYTYNLDGSIATIKYPGSRIVTYATSNAQRPTSAKDTTNSINYAQSATYAPPGGLASALNGKTGSFGGITESRSYNNRLEITRIQAPPSVGTSLDLSYSYGSGNNGNIATQTNNATSGRTQTYTYDPLNRLLTAQSAATTGPDCWGQSFGNNATPPSLGDDALANLLAMNQTKCSPPSLSVSVDTHDHISSPTGYLYDSAGSMTIEPGLNSYAYDAENRMITASTASGLYCYTYDGNGLRVMKALAKSGQTCASTGNNAPTPLMLYWRDIAGNTIAETDGSGSTANPSYNEYVFFAGRRIAQSNPNSGNQYYYFADHLGSTRLVTDKSGNACYEADYFPYGGENTPNNFSNSCSTNYRFTGYEEDAETSVTLGNQTRGMYYAFARHYNSRLGRFMSADPLDGDITDPQSLNHYTYARNNPVNGVDPTGLCESGDPSCSGGCDPSVDPSCGGGGGGGGGGGIILVFPQPPQGGWAATIGSLGDFGANPDDPWAFGCESLGMPCGMQFPSGGGDPSGCTYGSGSCGGMANGYIGGIDDAIEIGFAIRVLVTAWAIIESIHLARNIHLPRSTSVPKPTTIPRKSPACADDPGNSPCRQLYEAHLADCYSKYTGEDLRWCQRRARANYEACLTGNEPIFSPSEKCSAMLEPKVWVKPRMTVSPDMLEGGAVA